MMEKMKFKEVVNTEFNVKSFDDRRKKVNRIIYAMEDENGFEYRKRLEFPIDTNYNQMVSIVKQ